MRYPVCGGFINENKILPDGLFLDELLYRSDKYKIPDRIITAYVDKQEANHYEEIMKDDLGGF